MSSDMAASVQIRGRELNPSGIRVRRSRRGLGGSPPNHAAPGREQPTGCSRLADLKMETRPEDVLAEIERLQPRALSWKEPTS